MIEDMSFFSLICTAVCVCFRGLLVNDDIYMIYEGYLESKYSMHTSLVHPRDCHFVDVQ
jgi:hypothetical protein